MGTLKPYNRNGNGGFTLTELLTIIAVIAILAALLFPALWRVKAQGQSTACKSHLSQIGKAMTMYVSDYNIYPSAHDQDAANADTSKGIMAWAQQLSPYCPVNWTNLSWHCPSYLAEGGLVEWVPPPPGGGTFKLSTSYSYNAVGMVARWKSLGLGDLRPTIRDHQILAPSQMFAVGDTRPLWRPNENDQGYIGAPVMRPWSWPFDVGIFKGAPHGRSEANPPHSGAYNLLFVDSHVDLVKRRDYLYPPLAAQHWNRDNQPHPEEWEPTNKWAVKN
jgi:prepilin-type processing-associated H-X9-DG protein